MPIRKFFRAFSALPQPIGILQRYRQFQQEFPGHLVLMQVGDFYEIYGEAVEGAAKILDITVTKSPGKQLAATNEPIPMTGFPLRSFDTFLSKLIRSGVSVVVADQVSLPDSSRFDRKVSRVITPGTVVEENLLDRNQNNFLLLLETEHLTCAWMDISTGDFFTTTCATETELLNLLNRLKPREVLLMNKEINSSLQQFFKNTNTLLRTISCNDDTISCNFDAISNDHFTEIELSTSNKLVSYVKGVMRNSFITLKPLKKFAPARKFMSIDADSFQSLDISGSHSDSCSLFSTLNECKTALGSRLLARRLQTPLLDSAEIDAALDRVEAFYHFGRDALESLRKKLDQVGDIERILQRLSLRRPQGVSRDLRSLAKSLLIASEAFQISSQPQLLSEQLYNCLKNIPIAFHEKLPLRDSEGELFVSSFDPELDNLRKLRDNSTAVFEELAATYRQSTGIPNLRIVPFKGDQFVVEIPKSVKVTDHMFRPLMQTETKSRYVTEELMTKSLLLRTISDRIIDHELKLLCSLLDPVLSLANEIRCIADRIAQVDLESCFALQAIERSYTRPKIVSEDQLEIIDGRHPILDKLFTSYNPATPLRHFTPNSLRLHKPDNSFLLLTGPNMGGKSTFLRQTALIVLMAQCGSFVPAASCSFRPIDAIFTRIGASDDLARDRSTFMVEMGETAHILQNATESSLVLIDEIGRGTSSIEGIALASSIAHHLLNSNRSWVLFATHYHEIINSPLIDSQKVQLARTDADVAEDGSITLIPKIVPGLAKHSYALPVATLAGIPPSVINNATIEFKRLCNQE